MNMEKKQVALEPEAILAYLIGNNDELDTLIMCRSAEFELLASDLALYEALGSIKDYDNFKLNKLTKLLEVTNVVSARLEQNKEKSILKEERVEQLRKLALGEK